VPLAEEWARFEFYARRVRVLSCEYEGDSSIDDEMFKALVGHFQESPALPNLRDLRCFQNATIHSYMWLFLAPTLAHLLFYPCSNRSPSPAVVASAKAARPSLRMLHILPDNVEYSRDLFAATSELIGSLYALESLRCRFPLTPATILHLARLSTLTDINLFDHPHAIVRSLAGTSTPAFAYLTTLRIRAWDGPSTVELLRVLCIKRLNNLRITFCNPSAFENSLPSLKEYHPSAFTGYHPSLPDDSELAQIFAAACTHSNLQSLSIDQLAARRHSSLTSPDIIRPLFSHRNLTSLHIDTIRDTNVRCLSLFALPAIQRFNWLR